MSTNSNTLIQNLNLYGNSGSDSILVEISKAVQPGGKFGTVHRHLALKVSKHIFHILDQRTKPNMMSHALTCLMGMCESYRNSEAKSFLKSLENTTILKHCVQGCRQRQHPVQLLLCSYILHLYASDSDKRCCEMLQHAGLLEAVLMVIDSFQQDAVPGDPQESMASNHALLVMQKLLQCTHPLERIVRAGGRQTLDTMLHKVAAVCKATVSNPEERFTTVFDNCVSTCIICYDTLLERKCELVDAGLSIADIFYSREQVLQIMQSWHLVFAYLWHAQTSDEYIMNNIHAVLMLCTSGCASTQRTCVATGSEIESRISKIFTLKAPSLDDPTVDDTFVLFVLKLAVQYECADFADQIFHLVYKFPSLKMVIDECVGRYRFCAHPDCAVSSFVHGALRKCARCRSHSVWYCGKEHQIAHWPEHKLTCNRCNSSSYAVKPV